MIIHNPIISGSIQFPADAAGNKVTLKVTNGTLETIQLDSSGDPTSVTPVSNLSGSFSGSFIGDGSNLTGVSAINIDALSSLGGASVAQGDSLIISDAGTEKKVTFSNLEDSVFANISGDATIAAGGVLTLASIANSKLANSSITVDGSSVSLGGSVTTLQIGTSGTTALAGNTTVISTAQTNAITANTAKNTNVSTNLTITGTSAARTIVSSDGTDAIIPIATTSVSGLLSPSLFDEIDANTAKVTDANHNVSTNLSKTVSGTGFAINSSDGDNVALSLADTNNWGIISDEMFDKLDGIETSADVTDTTNVTSAGALMDSEVTNLGQVKAFDSSDYATSAQGTTANNALPKAGGAMTGAITTNSTFDGRDVATDGSKLDGIASSANNYVLPTNLAGDDVDIDTTPLTGAVVISDLDINITTNTSGLVTDANGSVATRTLTKGDLGLGNVDNTSDSGKPVSTAGQTALDLKANLASPSLTGNPTAPTQADNDNSTKVATTAYVQREVSDLLGGAPAAFDTLLEISASIANGDSDVVSLTTTVGTKLAKSSNLSDLTNASTSRTNLGVDAAGTDNSTNVTLVTSAHDYLSVSGQAITLGSITNDDLAGSIAASKLAGSIGNSKLSNSAITVDGNSISLGGSVSTLQLGTSNSTALAGNTTTISGGQTSAITANTAKNTNVSTNLTISGTSGARTIVSSDGTNAIIPIATTSVSGLLSPGLFDEIDVNTAKTGISTAQRDAIIANTAKNTNVSTNLSISGTSGARTIASSDGTDAIIPIATTSVSGLLSPSLFDEIDVNTAKTGITTTQRDAIIANTSKTGISGGQTSAITANTAKNTNVSTNLSKTVSGTGFAINSSDGTNVSLSLADTNNWGIISDEMFDKLDGIETSADVTDTTNVTAAGAVMDSELTSIGDVKALNQSVVSGATPTFTVTNFTDVSNKRFMSDTQETKLDSVESSADVTDTANVKTALNASFGGTANIGDGSDTITIPGDLVVTGTTTTENVTTLTTSNGIVFEGSVADEHEATLLAGTLSGDRTLTLPNATGTIALTSNLATVGDGGLTQNNFTNTLKSKLDGIEGSATADQTNAEIRTAVEAASDSNVFTDSDHSKLDGIESNATADQSNAEIKAAVGAANDSNIFTDTFKNKLNTVENGATADQSLADLNISTDDDVRFDSLGIGVNASGTTGQIRLTSLEVGHATDTTITRVSSGVIAVEGTTVQLHLSEGGFANGDKTKLDGIDASADVNRTDAAIKSSIGTGNSKFVPSAGSAGTFLKHDGTFGTPSYIANTNTTTTSDVTSAGALMDSEVTNLGQVKAFDSSDYATSSQGTKADSAQQPPSEGAFGNGDKTKLDAIEESATADQSASELRSAIGTGNGNLVPSAGSAGTFLKHDGTFGTPSYIANTNTQLSSSEVRGKFTAGTNVTIASDGTISSTDTTTNTQLSQEQVQDFVGNMLGGTETGITVTYQDGTNDIDFVVASQTANDFTNTLKTKLDGIDTSADVNRTDSAIKSSIGTGNGKFVPASGTNGHFLKHDGSFGLPSYTTNTDVDVSIANLKIKLAGGFGGNAVSIGDSGDTVTIPGNLTVTGTTTTNNVETVSTSNGVVFEGNAADDNEVTLLAATVSSDRTITLPDATGTIALTSSTVANSTLSANSTLAGGLAIGTGRNDSANQIVRTEANGYVDFGWINTTSGTASGTLSRIYCSQDGYVRYLSPSNFLSSIGVAAGATNVSNNNQITNGAGYITSFDITAQTDGKYLRSNATDTASGAITFSNSTASSSKTTGAVIVTGGVGVGGALNVGGDIVAFSSSDERLKDNIELISNPIDKVKQLKGVTWDWNSNADILQQTLPNVGVIAQDVEKVLPQLVIDRDNGFKGVDYAKLTGLLIEAIKEQQVQIEELKNKIS